MDLQLSSIAADQTRRYPISNLRVNGHKEDLVLVVKWTGASREYQDGVANKAFTKLEGDESDAALYKLIAHHLVTGWDNVPVDANGKPLEYTPKRGLQVLLQFQADKRPDRRNRFLAFIGNGDNFEAPLVDGDELGNS